jgi:acetyl esterase/lipase
MKQLTRLFLVLVLVAALLPLGTAAAAVEATPCQTIAAALGATVDEGQINGAQYCIMYPSRWNQDVVVFAHGYVFADPLNPAKPPEIPWDQVIRGDLNLPGILVRLGYAFAISSYHKDGLAVKEGVQDVVALAKYLKKANKSVHRVFVTGASEGGLITTLAVQSYPKLFTGALSTCGPIGDFQAQVNYWGNFRVTFDQAFPFALRYPDLSPVPLPFPYPRSTPIFIDPTVMGSWGTETSPGPVGQVVGAMVQSQPAAVDALLTATGAPYDPADPTTKLATVAGLLTYNVMATDEARWELSGNDPVPTSQLPQMYGILQSTNMGNPVTYTEMVGGVPVTTQADPIALNEINTSYQTSGNLPRQLVVMHTTGDPIVPFWHVGLFTQKVLQSGSILKLSVIPISRYGHCNFTPAEAVFGFYVMVLRSTLMPFSAQQIQQALPDAASREKFDHLKTKFKDEVRGNNQ